jgi:predicted cobalt transporter CbtA
MNLGVGDLVAVANPTIKVLITYGVAAILWAVIGTVVGWLIRRTAAP